MKSEIRNVKVTVMTGVTDILFGLFMFVTGWHNWWYKHFHFFGVLGLSMMIYYLWYKYYYEKETGRKIWE